MGYYSLWKLIRRVSGDHESTVGTRISSQRLSPKQSTWGLLGERLSEGCSFCDRRVHCDRCGRKFACVAYYSDSTP